MIDFDEKIKQLVLHAYGYTEEEMEEFINELTIRVMLYGEVVFDGLAL